MSDTPILELRGVAVGYDRRALLRDLDFRIARGSFTGLLGANGSGKTTVLKTIAGILPPISGQLTFHPPATLGYVPQRDQLDSNFIFSALEVALMGVCGRIGAGRRIPRAERDHVRDCLRQAGAESVARQRFSELSGGQKQRVLIARALASRADFLILDEPTAGVDAAATNAIIDLLVRLNQERHLTIVMVNHDFTAVRRSADRVIWLHQGAVLQGSVGELLQRDRIEELLQLQFN